MRFSTCRACMPALSGRAMRRSQSLQLRVLNEFGEKREEIQLNLLLILLTPTTHSKPIKAMIPVGASVLADIGGDGGGSAITTKTGDPLSTIRCCIAEAVSVRIDHDIIPTRRERGMPDEHRTHIAIHDGYGLDQTCDIRRDLIAIVPVLIMDYVDVHVCAGGEA
ncbi:MAG: hypothetical protein C5S52_04420 [ANME-2 cluster archaeon]|nr:hypothetical protein [ANME-2 cluster archaeon]